jgi:hypothetical protein
MATTMGKMPKQLFLNDFTASASDMFGKRLGFVASLFGCSHKHLTRPFSHGGVGYRACLKCGARKKFNPETLETSGGFYYPPPAGSEHKF